MSTPSVEGQQQAGTEDVSVSRGQSNYEHDVSRPRLDLGKLREASLKDYGIRFVLGGAVSVLAALLSHWATPRFGGIFTAFPAILLASLTLIGEHDGQEESAEDAEGRVAGALALVVTAIFLSLTLTHLAGAAVLSAGLVLWLVVAMGIYGLAVRAGWLRTRETYDQQNPDDHKASERQ